MATNLKRLCLTALILALTSCVSVAEQSAGTVYLVRHAEKLTGEALDALPEPRDPPLSAAGNLRAERLAMLLGDAKITRIWSTDTTRTRDTAQPLADRLGIEVEIYDASDLTAFAARLRQDLDGNAVVVGHSNTTPDLAQALGADPGPPIVEKTEYDRLYVINLKSGQNEIQRFGAD